MDILQIRELKQSLERRDARILELERQLASQKNELLREQEERQRMSEAAEQLNSELAASRERVGRMREVIAATVKDLKMRADMKMDKSQRGVVDVGNSVWFALNEALPKAEKGEKE